ncbi:hypothetical protein L9F63_018641 [Diploptera punctata]|uniref:C-type lectin domain-containing protein n=1 Tax=Diploptera punctata TaxID=6984 RepID=A0AAD8EF07_DIPPU|nr:hypothetical protein L9F63_018641 [Diploptera punctata]
MNVIYILLAPHLPQQGRAYFFFSEFDCLQDETEAVHRRVPVATRCRWFVQIHLQHEDEQPLNMLIEESAKDTIAKVFPLNEEAIIYNSDGSKTPCPPPKSLGYHIVPKLGYYKVHDENKPWKGAEETCRQEGTHLLIINSEFEHQATKSMINRRDTAHWIGIHDQYKEGQFVTVLNETLDSTGWTLWYPAQPEGANQNCCWYLHHTPTKQFGIGDDVCSSVRPFICEQEF